MTKLLNEKIRGFVARQDIDGNDVSIGDRIRVQTEGYFDGKRNYIESVDCTGILYLHLIDGVVLLIDGGGYYRNLRLKPDGKVKQRWELIESHIEMRDRLTDAKFKKFRNLALECIERVFNTNRDEFLKRGKGERKLDRRIPRFVYCYALFKSRIYTPWTEEEVASKIGWDRASIRHGHDTVKDVLLNDYKYGQRVSDCVKEIDGLISAYLR